MDALGGLPARRSALVALIAVLVLFVGATSAYAGGRDHGSASDHQQWASGDSKGEQGQSGDEDKSWSDKSGDKSDSEDSGSHGDKNGGKDCKKNEEQSGEQTGSQGQPQGPPQGETGGQQERDERTHSEF